MTLLRPRGSLALATLVLLASLALPRVAAAQTGVIRGTVTDSATGRGVGSAQVRIAGSTRGTITNDDGQYTVTNLQPGTYGVSVERPGFQSASVKDIPLNINQTARVDVHLQVGDEGGVLDLPFAMSIRANVAVSASYGPGRRLKLADWIAVFGVDQSMYGEVQTSLRIEVR